MTETEEQEKKPNRAADMLQDFIESQTKERICLDDFIEALGGRAFGLAILLFAFANLLIANVPGISTVLGLPIILLSLQIVLGRKDFWVPKRLRQMEIKRATLKGMIGKANKILSFLEKLIRPRLTFLADQDAERWIGAFCLILGIVLALPILFGNFLPAWSLAFIALGLIEKDGLFALVGFLIGLLAIAYSIAFYVGGVELARGIMHYVFG